MTDLVLAQFDVFLLSHIVGWLVKAVIYPNVYVMLVRTLQGARQAPSLLQHVAY